MLFFFVLLVLDHHLGLVEDRLSKVDAVLFCETDGLFLLILFLTCVLAFVLVTAGFVLLIPAVVPFHAHLGLEYFALPHSDLVIRQRPVLMTVG